MITETREQTTGPFRIDRATALSGTAVAAAVIGSWWSTLGALADRWSSEPQYSHGFLVPVMAAVLVWMRRDRFRGARPAVWPGLAIIAASCAARLAGARLSAETLDAAALLPCVAGLCVFLGGRTALKAALPAVAFLAFMMPLPWRLEVALAGPLQQVATSSGTYVLQTFGYPAVPRGNTILVGDLTLGVAEACSGLRMLVVFIALSTAVAMVVKRSPWERLLIFVSSVPIALACNVARIAATGMLYASVDGETARWVFHDLAGWLMMPLALALLAAELKLLDCLLTNVAEDGDGLPRYWNRGAGRDGRTGALTAAEPLR